MYSGSYCGYMRRVMLLRVVFTVWWKEDVGSRYGKSTLVTGINSLVESDRDMANKGKKWNSWQLKRYHNFCEG